MTPMWQQKLCFPGMKKLWRLFSCLFRMEAKLVEAVEFSLRHFLYPNAIFLAERLHALSATEDSLALLASCHLQAGRANKAYSVLKSSRFPSLSASTKYLFATCCYKLGHLKEAEELLRPIATSASPNAASCNLLARVYKYAKHTQTKVLTTPSPPPPSPPPPPPSPGSSFFFLSRC